MIRNSYGEVADYPAVSQFEPGQSAYECGFFSVWLQKAAGQPGHGPAESAEWVDQKADEWYTRWNGANIPSNDFGMSLPQEWALLSQAGLNYEIITPPDKNVISAWVTKVGAPVLITVDETSVHTIGGEYAAYSWRETGTHIITVSGVDAKGNFLCRDTAAISTVPHVYDANDLIIHSATAIRLPWLPTFPAHYNPISGGSLYPELHSYNVRPGDTLATIASEHGIGWAHLYAANEGVIESAAKENNYPNSQGGNLIFPETVLHW